MSSAAELGQQAGAQGPEEALDLTFALGLMRPGVDQRDAELGTDQRELAGAVVGAVVDVEAFGDAAADQRLLEHRQERDGVFREGEGRVRDHPGSVVDEGDQIGFTAPAATVADADPVHHIAHPEFARVLEGEAPPVGARGGIGLPDHQPFAGQEPIDRGRRHRQIGGDRAALAGALDHEPHRELGVLLFHGDERLGNGIGQAAGLTAIGAPLRQQRLEPAFAVELEPVAQGLDGDAGAAAAGDGVVHPRLGTQLPGDAGTAGRQVDEIGDDAVAEQGHRLAVVVIGLGHASPPRSWIE